MKRFTAAALIGALVVGLVVGNFIGEGRGEEDAYCDTPCVVELEDNSLRVDLVRGVVYVRHFSDNRVIGRWSNENKR